MSTSHTQTPTVPGGIPLLGHALGLAMRPLKLLESQRPLGGVTALRIGPMNIRIVNDPDLLHEMLVARTKDFIRSGPVYEVSRAFVGNGLAMSEGAWHRRQRRMM